MIVNKQSTPWECSSSAGLLMSYKNNFSPPLWDRSFSAPLFSWPRYPGSPALFFSVHWVSLSSVPRLSQSLQNLWKNKTKHQQIIFLKSQKSFHHLSSDTTWLLDLHRIIFSVLSLTKMWFYFQLGQIRKLTRRYQTPVTGCYTIILHGSVSQSGHFRSSVLCEIHSQFLQTPCWP